MVILSAQSDLKYPTKIAGIPENYNFEVQKILKTIEKINAKKIALQFPDGLLAYAPLIIDTIQIYFKEADCTIINDVVYGACCVDDQSIKSDLLIHFGHSCLIPITEMETRVLYIFVDIKIDLDHLYKLILKNFKGKVAIIGTIQFNSSVNKLKRMIESIKSNEDSLSALIPQVKPLSPGEVLGCTSPVITGVENVVYLGDGRFHLESAMIRNPNLNFFKYCPFTRKLTEEFYDFKKMKEIRENEIKKALQGKSFGIILGSLGRQGNKKIFQNVVKKLESLGKYKIFKIVVDEINQKILDNFEFIDSFVQVSCPRLSIDWGVCYKKPLLSPFELFYENDYKMDYYSSEGSAPWKNYNNEY
jgi:2-(3-amino-3-carboxypropyl)histidine synthase